MIKFKNICPNLKNLWFTSDLHRSHKNLCLGTTTWEGDSKKGCRDFSSVEGMDKTIVDNINKYVKEDDVLIHCGDWSFANEENIEILRSEINCKNVYGIQGNHDHLKYNAIYEKIFKEYNQISYYSCEGVKFICTHYPIFHWHEQSKGVISVHGHCHSNESEILKQIHNYGSLDVGIDNAYKMFGIYRPYNALEICNMLKSKLVAEHH